MAGRRSSDAFGLQIWSVEVFGRLWAFGDKN